MSFFSFYLLSCFFDPLACLKAQVRGISNIISKVYKIIVHGPDQTTILDVNCFPHTRKEEHQCLNLKMFKNLPVTGTEEKSRIIAHHLLLT